MKKILFGLVAILSMVLLVACGEKKEAKAAEPKLVKYNLRENPPQLDPQLCTDSVSGIVLGHIFEGLTSLGKDGKPQPGVAESWTNEGNVWTFKLRKDAKWHNGDPVVAGDFVAAWERALNPEVASQYSYIMYSIKGAQEYNEGKIKDFAEVGVKATDDNTLVVEVKEPVAYFASLVSFYTFLPLNKKFLDEHKDAYATSAETILGNGPFKMTSWEFESKIIVEKADTYWNKANINIDKIEMPMINDNAAGLKAYQNDELDFQILPAEELAKFKDSPERITWDDGSVWYFEFNVKNKLFANKNIRKAISLAVDRKTLVEKIKAGSGKPAESLIPSVMPGKKGFFREDYPESAYGLPFNPTKAKELFAQGLKELGMASAPAVTLLSGNSDAAQKEAQFYQEQLKVNLGLEVKIEAVTHQIRIQRMNAKDFEMVLAGWGPDYNDPMTYLDMFLTNGGNNHTGWGKPEYDALIQSAKIESDPAKRMDFLQQAEAMLMDELPISPTWFRQVNAVVKPHVKGTVVRAMSPDTDFRFADIQK